MYFKLRYLLLAAICHLVLSSDCKAQMPSDKPCDAPAILANAVPGVCVNQNIELCCGGTMNYSNFLGVQPACGNSVSNRDAWLEITGMTAGQQYNLVYIEKGNRWTWVEVYELPQGKNCSVPANYKSVVCTKENDVINFTNSTATATFTPENQNSRYYIRFMRANTTPNDTNLEGSICITKSYPNDEPCGATPLIIQNNATSNPVTGQNYNAADWQPQIYTGPTCGPNNDVWYKFVAESCSANVYVKNLTTDSYEIQAAILESVDGNCNNLREITACGGAKNKYDDIVLSTDGLTVGRTYYIIIDGFSPPYFNATGKHSIVVYRKPNAPECPKIKTPCDCSTSIGCTGLTPFPNSTTGNFALTKAKGDPNVSGCVDLTPSKIPILGGSNKAEFCATYTAVPGDDLMAFDNVLHKDGNCEFIAAQSKNVVYVSGLCTNPLVPVCTDVNGISPIYKLTPGVSYKFCKQVVANGSDLDCIGKFYQSYCAFLWKIPSKTTIDRSVCYGKCYNFNNIDYCETGNYTANLKSANNCDSTVTLNLTVLPNVVNYIKVTNICPEDGYKFGDKVLFQSGTYSKVFTGQSGCDSTVVLDLNILPKNITSQTRDICRGDTLKIGNQKFSEQGLYILKLNSSKGCDSILNLTVGISDPTGVIRFENVCYGDTFFFEGKGYSRPGLYLLKRYKVNKACDSLLRLNLNVLPDYSDIRTSKTICYGQCHKFGDSILCKPGVYKHTYKRLQSGMACDSTVTLTLSIEDKVETNIVKVICFNETFKFDNVVYDSSVKVTKTYVRPGLCDSIVSLDLTVRPKLQSGSETFEICEGKGISFDGVYYDRPGIFDHFKKYPEGCDSALVKVTIKVVEVENPPFVYGYLCKNDFFEYNGKKYTAPGKYTDTTFTTLGCPSKITTIFVSKEKDIKIDITKSIESCPGKCDASAKAIVTNPASPITFKWSNGMSTQEIKGLCEGKYSVTIVDNDGCSGTAEVVIESNPAQFTISVTTTNSSCDKASDGTATVTSPIGAGYTYEWTNGQKGATATGLKPGSFSVVVKDVNGCTNKKEDIVISPNPSPVKIDMPSRDSMVNGQVKTIVVKTSPTGGMTFAWSPSSTVKDKGNNTFEFSPSSDTKYTVTATDANGCTATAMIFLKVSQVKFPTIFSPNAQDGNGLFQPTFIPDGVKVTNLLIFDRWGTLVYSYKDQKTWWNGKFKNDGEELASDVYAYYLEYTIDGNALPGQKGDITLIR